MPKGALLAAAALTMIGCWSPVFGESVRPVLVLTQSGAIGPASADYLKRGLAKAVELNAQLVVLEMDTPGGLDVSMREIIQNVLASPIPVASFVAPNGARAASAGTYILYASHIAAMAPATNLGAAAPIAIGAAFEPEVPARKEPGKGSAGMDTAPQSSAQTLMRKQTNDAAAYIRGLAQLRGRNAAWAEKAVREAVSLSAQEALDLKVIDLIAADVPQLLAQLDGRELSLPGRAVQLATARAETIAYQPDWRTRLLAVIADPSIAYILLLVGIYGLLFEFLSPGYYAPGVIGAISLLLAMFALQMLPVSFTGLALIAVGVGLFLAEHFVPGFGVLGVGGIVALVIGSIMLIDSDVPGLRIPWPLIGAAAVAGALVLLLVLNLVLRARARPVASGRDAMLGLTGEVFEIGAGIAYARIHGEIWKVRSGIALDRGQSVRVTGIDGLLLTVEPVKQGETR